MALSLDDGIAIKQIERIVFVNHGVFLLLGCPNKTVVPTQCTDPLRRHKLPFLSFLNSTDVADNAVRAILMLTLSYTFVWIFMCRAIWSF